MQRVFSACAKFSFAIALLIQLAASFFHSAHHQIRGAKRVAPILMSEFLLLVTRAMQPLRRSSTPAFRIIGIVIDQEAIEKLNPLIESGPFEVHVARTFRLEEAAEAHRALGEHYLGKLALRLS